MEKNIINHLTIMIENDAAYYDEDLALFLLRKVDSANLKKYFKLNSYSEVSTSFYGHILLKNIGAFIEPKTETENYNKISGRKNIDKWADVLKKVDPELALIPNLNIENMCVSIWGYVAVRFPRVDKSLLGDDIKYFMKKIVNNDYYNEDDIRGAIKILVNNQKVIDEVATNRGAFLLKDNIKKLLKHAEEKDLKILFNENSLKNIMDELLTLENSRKNAALFTSLLSIAEPENWMKAFNNGKFKIDSFFNTIFATTYGVPILNNIKQRYSSGNEDNVLKRIQYLSSGFKNIDISTESMLNFWMAVLKTKSYKLLKESYLNIPFDIKKIEELKNDKFKETQIDFFNKFKYYKFEINEKDLNNEHLSFSELIPYLNKEKLSKELNNKLGECNKERLRLKI